MPALESRLKIGELARLAGKTIRAIHLYEELELLTPAERSPGGFRLYDTSNLERIQFIDKMQRLGLSLGDIRGLLHQWTQSATAPGAMKGVEELYRAKLAETRAQIRELRALEGELLINLSYLEGCQRCETPAEPVAACPSCERPHTVPATELITGLASP
ncbi:MerR family DNA-binding protein [Myxococcota bacterium]|jgi:DNA-binding transcriptional MerR regulator|nr:MerR family DNA-binding protein [Myxococcota bacterium]